MGLKRIVSRIEGMVFKRIEWSEVVGLKRIESRTEGVGHKQIESRTEAVGLKWIESRTGAWTSSGFSRFLTGNRHQCAHKWLNLCVENKVQASTAYHFFLHK